MSRGVRGARALRGHADPSSKGAECSDAGKSLMSRIINGTCRKRLLGWRPAFRWALPGILAALLLASLGLSIVAGGAPFDATAVKTSPEEARLLESKIRELSGSEAARPKSFQQVVITEGEANSYLKYHGQQYLPPSVHDPAIHITRQHVVGAADVDFEEFSRTASKPNDWGPKVLAAMFKGRQRVTAVGKLDTYNGRGVAKIETVSVGTTQIPDWLVDLVMENYLKPRFNIDLSKPFVLPDHVTRIELGSGQATFFRSPNKQP
jgi:hypothetical protein